MGNRVIVVGGLVASFAALAWIAWQANVVATTPDRDRDAAAGDAASRVAGAVEAPAAPSVVAARQQELVFAEHAPRPPRHDATWVQVQVIDDATNAPVEGAEVVWYDETVVDAIERRFDSETFSWRLDEHPALAELVPEAVWRTRTDGEGRARVSVGLWCRIAASHGDRHGVLEFWSNTVQPRDGFPVRLVAERSTQVHVVDAAGAPCPGVPLTLSWLDAAGGFAGGLSLRSYVAITGADGAARLAHLQVFAAKYRMERAGSPPDAAAFVRVALPGCEGVRAEIDPDAPPATLVLRLPPHGSMRVRMEANGRPMPGFRSARLSVAEDVPADEASTCSSNDLASREARVMPDGMAHFDYVPVGMRFHIETSSMLFRDGSEWERAYAGPTEAGQDVEVVVTPKLAAPTVARGRVLGEGGAPLVDASIEVCAAAVGVWRARIRTDADGRFLVAFDLRPDPDVAPELFVDWRSPAGALRRGVVRLPAPETVAQGEVDLGDILLRDPPVLVRGRIERDGRPFGGPCELQVQRAPDEDLDGKTRFWPRVMDAQPAVRADGSFIVYGANRPGRYRLQVDGDELLCPDPVAFEPGATDVVVRLATVHDVAASALLPVGAPLYTMVARLVPQGVTGGEPVAVHSAVKLRVPDGAPPRVDFGWSSIRPGRYVLQLHSSIGVPPVHVVDDVVVPPPPGGDPRLVDVDLRAKLRIVMLLRDGEEWPNRSYCFGVAVIGPRPQTGPWPAQAVNGAESRLLLPAGPYELIVYSDQSRPQAIRGDSPTVALTLHKFDRVAMDVQLLHAPPPPPGWVVVAQWHEPTLSAVRYVTKLKQGDGHLGSWSMSSLAAGHVTNGSARVDAGSGPGAVRFWLVNPGARTGERSAIPVHGAQPEAVFPSTVPIPFFVPMAAWQEAFAAVTASAGMPVWEALGADY